MSGFNLDNIARVMVLGAHPDDEIIGSGGTIHMLSSQGREVDVVTFTDGGTAANSPEEIAEMIVQRKKEMDKTDRILGVTTRELLQIPSQKVYDAVYGRLRIELTGAASGTYGSSTVIEPSSTFWSIISSRPSTAIFNFSERFFPVNIFCFLASR